MEYSNNRRLFPSVSKEKDHCSGGRQCICWSFSLMKNLNPIPHTRNTLIFAKLSWSIDYQFSSPWLGKACDCSDEHTAGFSTVSFSQPHLMVMLFSKEATTGTKKGGSQPMGCCDRGVRFKSLLWCRFNYSKQNGIVGKDGLGSAVLQLMT